MMRALSRKMTGAVNEEEREYEIRHRALARQAGAEGMVLLRNEKKLLPLPAGKPLALYGAGAVKTIKGGTGSGDVNSRPAVSVRQGLENAGFPLTTTGWLDDYERAYTEAREQWRDEVWAKMDAMEDQGIGAAIAYFETPFSVPAGALPDRESDGEGETDTALYVIARNAGEGADRYDRPGDYELSGAELAAIEKLTNDYTHVILILNTGGLIDLSFTERFTGIDAILYIHQPGMEAGNAVADILSGAAVPSGKLTDSWAFRYADYPNAATFSHNNGDVTNEKYTEGLYVGYRYFDTFGIPTRYSFGYGLSYTEFSIRFAGLTHYDLGTELPSAGLRLTVTNIGVMSGREVAQLYVSCPQTGEGRELRRLVGFAKTKELEPKETEEVEIRFPLYALASFDETLPGWTLPRGEYVMMVGSSLASAETVGVIHALEDFVFERTEHICVPESPVLELRPEGEAAIRLAERRRSLIGEAQAPGMASIVLHGGDIVSRTAVYGPSYEDTPEEVRAFVEALSEEQLILLATGDVAKAQGASNLGNAGNAVPGSAAQTSDCAREQGLSDIVLADGPAGLRLNRVYEVRGGRPQNVSALAALEDGYLQREDADGTGDGPARKEDRERRYQYTTAFPVGTALAQSWNPELLRRVGAAVGEELVEFGVTLWLAPGMNIHRNPLCGRNFEYYSEDPLLSGMMAAAVTQGVQSVHGVGTTIKHFACNNQEDNRMGSNSILRERTLREIYLKGFEIAVKTAQPMSIMTSYNRINGVHAANSYDLCTKAARNEWGFAGVIMTDWTTTHNGPDCTASGCMRAGNDLVMPGCEGDHENLRRELAEGTLKPEELRRSIARLVNIVRQSNFTADM